jgi:tetratricopeptide (TPR) repeat protein
MGKYADAVPLARRVLAIREKEQGPDHPDVATALNNLALLYLVHGRYLEAEPHFKRSLAIREKALGPDHPDIGDTLNNLAALYQAQHRRRLSIGLRDCETEARCGLGDLVRLQHGGR